MEMAFTEVKIDDTTPATIQEEHTLLTFLCLIIAMPLGTLNTPITLGAELPSHLSTCILSMCF